MSVIETMAKLSAIIAGLSLLLVAVHITWTALLVAAG